VSNVPFTKVEVPKFVDLLEYTHHGLTKLVIPGAKAVKQRVLKLSEATIEELKELFEVCLMSALSGSFFFLLKLCQKHTAKVTLVLDAWTSSNGYAFLAIIARYITAEFELGESTYSFVAEIIVADFCVL
jgi:hypothetical protein